MFSEWGRSGRASASGCVTLTACEWELSGTTASSWGGRKHTHTEILTNIQKKRKGVERSNNQHTPYTKTAGTQSIETNLCQMRRHYIRSQQNLTDDRKHKESAPSLMGCWKDPQLLSSSQEFKSKHHFHNASIDE